MKKSLVYILFLIIGLIIGIISTIIWYGNHSDTNPQNHLQTWYYVWSMFGSFGTVAAVVVALFMDEIKGVLYHAVIDVGLFDEGDGCGIIESIDENEQTPSARHYECSIMLANKGNHAAENCEVKLIGVTYMQKDGARKRELLKSGSCRVNWSSDEKTTTIYTKEKRRIALFRVYPQDSNATPDASKKSTKRIDLIGLSLPENCNKNGIWNFSYKVIASQKELCTFTIKVIWDGNWRTRLPEMKNGLSVNLEKQ